MKKIVFLVGLFLPALFFCGCSDDNSEDGVWVNKEEALYKHNRKKISVEVGVYGT